MASAAAAVMDNGVAWQALQSLDRAPDQRVLGFAARVALELSKAGAGDVRTIIGGGDAAKWNAPFPDKLRQTVGGTACDIDPSKLRACDWVPMPSAGQVSAAKAFLRDHVMGERLASWRNSLEFDGKGCCNLGCGCGLQCIVCRVCGVVEQESAAKHLKSKSSRAVHDARAEEQRRTAAVRDKMHMSAIYAGQVLGKRERSAAGGKEN